MSDEDTLIRDRLGAAASAVAVAAEPGRVHEGVARHRRRIRRRRRGVVVLGVVAALGAGSAAVALTADRDPGPDVTVQADAPPPTPTTEAPETGVPTTSEIPTTSEMPTTQVPGPESRPRFLAAPGWEVVQEGFTATASSIPMGPDTRSGSVPWDTVERLGPDDVVLTVAAIARGEGALVDGGATPAELPLSLDELPPGGLEGNPEVGLTLRTLVAVDGWNLDLMVFFGTAEPSAATRAVAQEQLARLEVPPRAERVLSDPPGDACQPADLQLRLDLQEVGGIVEGRIRLRNDGAAACALEGQLSVELRDATSPYLDVIPTASSPAPPAWQTAGADAPAGLPTIRIAPGSEAQAVLTVRNWCAGADDPPLVFARLPYHPDRVGRGLPTLPALPRCDDAPQPPELTIGPFEPLRPPG